MSYQQDPPFCIQVELAEGCNLRCDFCAVQSIQEKQGKDYNFMTEHTISVLGSEVARLGWNPRIELAMHGEPTMHPEVVEMVRLLRAYLPRQQLMMTSNGGGLLPNVVQKLRELFDAGLNVFAFDAYESVKIHEKVGDALFGPNTEPYEQGSNSSFSAGVYPDNPEFNPHVRRPKGTRLFVWVRDISKATKGTHANLTNQGGTAAAPNQSREGERCAKPFRELSVRWDGNVAVCCDDWRGVYKCGNVAETPLDELWNGPRFAAARVYLIKGERSSLKPCDGCDVRSNRVGLLPDKFGVVKLPDPTQEDADQASEAMSGAPYSKVVAREWELVKLGRK